MRWADPWFDGGDYEKYLAYGQSKTANVLFAVEAARRWAEDGITVNALNPGRITGLADFADSDKTIALCAVEVPCGAAAATVFARAGLTPRPDTLEQDVAAALTKVELDVARDLVVEALDEALGAHEDRNRKADHAGQARRRERLHGQLRATALRRAKCPS